MSSLTFVSTASCGTLTLCIMNAMLNMVFYYICYLYFSGVYLCYSTCLLSRIFEFCFLQSPTSMCVTLEQVKRGGSMSFDDVFRMEYRMSQKFMVIVHFALIFACFLTGL